jgi:hypothetical protein
MKYRAKYLDHENREHMIEYHADNMLQAISILYERLEREHYESFQVLSVKKIAYFREPKIPTGVLTF